MNAPAPTQSITHYFESLTRFGIKPGLERMRHLLEDLGHPESQYPVVLVGGTNGKGSVVEFLTNILRVAGYKTGTYTSPHLWRYTERIRINGCEISEEEMGELLDRIGPHVEVARHDPSLGDFTEFEMLTLLAFLNFAEQKIDIAILEVGLGGRWDATNASNPLVSVITHVGLDHTDRLGNDLVSIAREKIPILRSEGVLVTGEQNPEVLEVFRTDCLQQKAAMLRLGQHFDVAVLQDTPTGLCLSVRTPTRRYDQVESTLVGVCQAENVALAVMAAESLVSRSQVSSPLRPFDVPEEAIRSGIGATRLAGRFDTVATHPTVLLDGANNPEGARVLAESLQRYYGDRRIFLVIGISQDKDVESMVAALAPVACHVIATQANHPRAAPAERIVAALAPFKAQVQTITPVMDAVRSALTGAMPEDVLCIAGSFYVLGEVDLEGLQVSP